MDLRWAAADGYWIGVDVMNTGDQVLFLKKPWSPDENHGRKGTVVEVMVITATQVCYRVEFDDGSSTIAWGSELKFNGQENDRG